MNEQASQGLTWVAGVACAAAAIIAGVPACSSGGAAELAPDISTDPNNTTAGTTTSGRGGSSGGRGGSSGSSSGSGGGEQSLGKDPGPRAGAAGAGSFYPTLNANEQAFFTGGLGRFEEVDSVSGTLSGEEGKGLGPTFNGNSCAMCHAQPMTGGSSPGMTSPQNPVANPQVALATLDGATNIGPVLHHRRPGPCARRASRATAASTACTRSRGARTRAAARWPSPTSPRPSSRTT